MIEVVYEVMDENGVHRRIKKIEELRVDNIDWVEECLGNNIKIKYTNGIGDERELVVEEIRKV